MPTSRFIQIHALVSYSAALLNRDDSGLAKRLPFGGSTRTRISSQCLKRHWRKTEDEWALSKIGPEMAVRSRKIPEERLRPDLDRAEAGSQRCPGGCRRCFCPPSLHAQSQESAGNQRPAGAADR